MSAGFGWVVFAGALVEQGQKDAFQAGLEAFVRLYYGEFEDAVEIDGKTLAALEALNQISNFNVLDDDIFELVSRVQEEMTSETGRTFTPIE